MARLLAVCVVHQLLPDAGTIGVTAIDKRPVDGPVKVGRYGIYADVQANRKHHGGLDKALYAYAQEDADFWAGELGRDLAPGFFGENLRTEGIDVNSALVGERWRIGERVEVEVTMPRTPCQTFARWVGGADERGWVTRFSAERRLGPYLRVVTGGRVRAGDEIVVVHRPDGAPTILERYRDPA
ncbi:MOSC domain-containing protein [Microbacterium ulmi]|uniref:MOSC domain-containing protein n=1 Tax=Microbacterium ulmi TaxID=179095 RepID=A0A7Y2Q357_9MICO|nr:MOSC domain-containing protein [Microbacterium ulmi]NII68176.1 MOSC domain-containing protein YiiM [Microbacterium ulmi]NNH05368.1 MOSC domain-containing protein [Microbacterium ulmi]